MRKPSEHIPDKSNIACSSALKRSSERDMDTPVHLAPQEERKSTGKQVHTMQKPTRTDGSIHEKLDMFKKTQGIK